jgi:hypothetical protein
MAVVRQTIKCMACAGVAAVQGNYYGAFKKDALTMFQAIRAELGESGSTHISLGVTQEVVM